VHLPRVPGAIVGDRYRILRIVARGGTGVVYEAEHTWTGRRVAVKMLLSRLAGGDAQMERFRREARSAAMLEHPHIVEILDMGCDTEDGALFLVQALLAGEVHDGQTVKVGVVQGRLAIDGKPVGGEAAEAPASKSPTVVHFPKGA